MDGETTLYPRYLVSQLPASGKTVSIVGQILNISENNSLTLECGDIESTKSLIQTNNKLQSKFPEVSIALP